jgi:cell division GTPase FtsZ
MDPRPVPGEEPNTTLDHAAAALDGLLSSDDYIRIDEDDVRNICADVAATLVVMEAVSPATIGGTFGDRLSDLGIPGGAVTGALVAIEGPKDMGLSEASSIVDEVRGNLTDEANIIWGLNLADTGATHVTVLVATPRER